MLMFYSVGAETAKRVTCGNVAAAPRELPKNASCLRCASFNGIQGEWFQLYIDEALYGFAEELEQAPLWRDFERGNYPLYFKSAKIAEDFKTAVQGLLELSPSGEGVFLPIHIGLENSNICGVISNAEFFKLLEDCKIFSNVCYIIRKAEDLTERFLKAKERGLFTESERPEVLKKISAQLPTCKMFNDDNVWWNFYDETSNIHIMLHGYLKLLFTNADISLDGAEIVKCADYDAPAFSIDLNAVKEILSWHCGEYVVNPLFFSANDLLYATI